MAKALKAERNGKWAKALELFVQAQKKTEEAESKAPAFAEAQLKLKNTASALSRTDDLLRTHKRVLEINCPSTHNNNWKQYLFTNKYVGKEMEDWLTLLVNQYFEAQGKFRSGKGGPEFLKEVTDLETRATQNVRAVETAIDKRLKEIRKPIKVAYVTANRDEKEYITTYSWAMENCYITWFAPDGKGNLADMQGKQLDPSAYNDIWIHQLRYNEPPARGRAPKPAQALMPELMRPETIKAMREYMDKGGGLLLTGIAGLYTLPLGIETNAPDRLRENRLYIAARFGLGLIPVAGCGKHPMFEGFPTGGFYTSGNTYLNNLVTECAWDERKPGGMVLANELDETTGRQNSYAAIVEYHPGSGKALVLGGKSCDYTPDDCPGAVEYRPYKVNKDKYWASLRDQYRRFTLNALVYLASKEKFSPEPAPAGSNQSSWEDLPAQGWLANADSNQTGAAEGWYKPDYDAKNWPSGRLDTPLTSQDPIMWYRLNFNASNRNEKKSLLWLEGVRGEISIYIDGRLVGACTNRLEYPVAMDITEALGSATAHLLALRAKGPGGIRLPMSIVYTEMKTNEAPLEAVLKARKPIAAVIPRVTQAGGDSAKVDWTHSLSLGNWYTVAGAATEQEIKSYLAHDGQYLYIKLDHVLNGTKLKSSDEIWGGDVWELFFSTSRYEPPYRQIAVNVPGKHASFRYGEEARDWDSGAKIVSSSDSGHWQISLALPLDKLLPDGLKTGDAFYANFYRQVTSSGELLAWSPNFTGSFHELKRMGRFTLGS